jgi:hypothetical protein
MDYYDSDILESKSCLRIGAIEEEVSGLEKIREN